MSRVLAAVVLAAAAAGAGAAPIVPRDDAEVVETLPTVAGDRAEERRLRRALAGRPGDAALATAAARRWLERARADGDPRWAGRALAALATWPDPSQAPDEVLLLQATLAQHLHDFDAAAGKLETLVARRPRDAQAWLTLATVRRVQGRLDDSDRACARLAAAGSAWHAAACRAENDGLRGRFDAARAEFERLLATPSIAPSMRHWLWVSRAELEQRAGDAPAAERAWQAALAAERSTYALIGLADHWIATGRPGAALALLATQPRHDAVLLRRAIAGTAARAADAKSDVREMRERIAQADERPGAAAFHAREQAMFALQVEARPERAWTLARENARRQREAADLLLLAQAARAVGGAAVMEAAQVLAESGVVDRRREVLP